MFEYLLDQQIELTVFFGFRYVLHSGYTLVRSLGFKNREYSPLDQKNLNTKNTFGLLHMLKMVKKFYLDVR